MTSDPLAALLREMMMQTVVRTRPARGDPTTTFTAGEPLSFDEQAEFLRAAGVRMGDEIDVKRLARARCKVERHRHWINGTKRACWQSKARALNLARTYAREAPHAED